MVAKSGRAQGAAVGSALRQSSPPTVGPGVGGVGTTPDTSHRCSPSSPCPFLPSGLGCVLSDDPELQNRSLPAPLQCVEEAVPGPG